jgi:hypothetical protein
LAEFKASLDKFSIFFYFTEFFEKADKLCDVDIGPLKHGRLTSLCKSFSETKGVPKMDLHNVPHRKNNKMLTLKKISISRMLFFRFKVV